MENLDYIDWASLVLVTVGAVNWGLVGLGQLTGASDTYNIVNILLGGIMGGQVESVVYLLVGLAGLYQIYFGYQLYEE